MEPVDHAAEHHLDFWSGLPGAHRGDALVAHATFAGAFSARRLPPCY